MEENKSKSNRLNTKHKIPQKFINLKIQTYTLKIEKKNRRT